MNIAEHWLRLIAGSAPSQPERVRVISKHDVQWGTPVFRAPALPTPTQLFGELPFTENFRPRFPRER